MSEKNDPVCYNCKGNHSAINRECPIRKREQTIRDTATKYNLSVAEVKKDISENNKNNIRSQNFPTISNNKNPASNPIASYAQKVSNAAPKPVTDKQNPPIKYNTQIPVSNNKSCMPNSMPVYNFTRSSREHINPTQECSQHVAEPTDNLNDLKNVLAKASSFEEILNVIQNILNNRPNKLQVESQNKLYLNDLQDCQELSQKCQDSKNYNEFLSQELFTQEDNYSTQY